MVIERDFFSENPREIAVKAFHESFHYPSGDILKTREFYEHILVETSLVKSSIMLINIATWTWHFLLAMFLKFLQLSSGVGIQNFQENSLSLQNQDFSTIRTTREDGSMLFLSKTRTSIIHGCSISHLSINSLLFHFGFTIGGLILVQLLRFSQNPSWMVWNYSKVHFFFIPRELLAFPHLLFFFSEFGLAWIVK